MNKGIWACTAGQTEGTEFRKFLKVLNKTLEKQVKLEEDKNEDLRFLRAISSSLTSRSRCNCFFFVANAFNDRFLFF